MKNIKNIKLGVNGSGPSQSILSTPSHQNDGSIQLWNNEEWFDLEAGLNLDDYQDFSPFLDDPSKNDLNERFPTDKSALRNGNLCDEYIPKPAELSDITLSSKLYKPDSHFQIQANPPFSCVNVSMYGPNEINDDYSSDIDFSTDYCQPQKLFQGILSENEIKIEPSCDLDFITPSQLETSVSHYSTQVNSFSQENILNHSLYGSSSSNHDYTPEVHSVQQNSHEMTFLSETKFEIGTDEEQNKRKRKKFSKNCQHSDEDYEIEDDDVDDEDDDDYVCSVSSKGSHKKYKKQSKSKRHGKYGGYDHESKKKGQNKRAALKYRDKRKRQDAENEVMLHELVQKNNNLKRQVQEKQHELMFLKKLFNKLVNKSIDDDENADVTI